MAAPRVRRDLGNLLERPMHLFLNVKERAGWNEQGARLCAIGRDDPEYHRQYATDISYR
jgi:GTP-binding protein Era